MDDYDFDPNHSLSNNDPSQYDRGNGYSAYPTNQPGVGSKAADGKVRFYNGKSKPSAPKAAPANFNPPKVDV